MSTWSTASQRVHAARAPCDDGVDAAAVAFTLAGRRCRIVCVDDVLPRHLNMSGSQRIRQCYAPDEVAHFQLGGHRWALVLQPDPAEQTEAAAPGTQPAIHALLTNRELQIVQLICNGLLTKQVSDRLRISEFTVRSYLKTIYCKLGVRSRGAMVYAYAQTFQHSKAAGRPMAARAEEEGGQDATDP
jgi:DNA-binding CsgD family transcriptional regulator